MALKERAGGSLKTRFALPITYELFSGNTMDQSTLTRSIERLKALYGLERITVVADRGLNSGGILNTYVKMDMTSL